jgi:hypothetical protein
VLHWVAVGLHRLDEFADDHALLLRRVEDDAAAGAELEVEREFVLERVVELASGEAHLAPEAGVARMQPDEAGVASGGPVGDNGLLKQGHLLALTGQVVRAGRADDTAAHDRDLLDAHSRPPF